MELIDLIFIVITPLACAFILYDALLDRAE